MNHAPMTVGAVLATAVEVVLAVAPAAGDVPAVRAAVVRVQGAASVPVVLVDPADVVISAAPPGVRDRADPVARAPVLPAGNQVA